jgi:hypothetical protein
MMYLTKELRNSHFIIIFLLLQQGKLRLTVELAEGKSDMGTLLTVLLKT